MTSFWQLGGSPRDLAVIETATGRTWTYADLAAAADMDAELEETTADELIAGGYLPQEPDEARAEDDPQATQTAEDSREGKLVFKPNELNQSGEDKEYFHPKDGHKFHAPKDANDHALKPDVEVTPDNTIKTIR